ncbi:hypothetical protein [Faecalimicrobium dakarense]|nr:hypothetical protein [[Clostridium] dakarense]
MKFCSIGLTQEELAYVRYDITWIGWIKTFYWMDTVHILIDMMKIRILILIKRKGGEIYEN